MENKNNQSRLSQRLPDRRPSITHTHTQIMWHGISGFMKYHTFFNASFRALMLLFLDIQIKGSDFKNYSQENLKRCSRHAELYSLWVESQLHLSVMPFLARQHFTSVSKQCSTFNEIWILDRTPTPRPGLIFWGKKCTEDYSPTDNDNAFGISLVPLKEHMLRVDLLPRENALFNMSILYKLIIRQYKL